MSISTRSQQPQLNPRASSQSGRASFSHNPFGPRRSTSVHSLHHSFQLNPISLNSTPTLKKLSAKFFHWKPSSSVSSISTGPITTATSLSPPTSECQLSLVLDPNSPVARNANLPQLITHQHNSTNKSNVSAQSIKPCNSSGLKWRSSSVISIANRSQSLSSLSHIPNPTKKSGHHQQPFVMDDDPDCKPLSICYTQLKVLVHFSHVCQCHPHSEYSCNSTQETRVSN